MDDASILKRITDEHDIKQVRRKWAYGRDLGEWDALRSCFHPDATVHVSWYSGPASSFVERSMQTVAARRPEERGKHWIGNMRAIVNGQRAVLETDVQILGREFIDGHLFDYASYARFFDLFEKREGEWKIFKMTCVYDKDRLDPVVPGAVPASFYEAIPLTGAESGFAFMRFRQTKRGRNVPPVVIGGSEDEARLRAEGDRWLAGR